MTLADWDWSNYQWTIPVVAALLAAFATYLLSLLRDNQSDRRKEARLNRNLRKVIYLELQFYQGEFRELAAYPLDKDKKIKVSRNSAIGRKLRNLSNPERMQYERIAPESVIGAFADVEITMVRDVYSEIHSFFEKYSFEPMIHEQHDPMVDYPRHIEQSDVTNISGIIVRLLKQLRNLYPELA